MVTPAEVRQIKKFDRTGMKLMGFKPLAQVKIYHNVKHSCFVYPDDAKIGGSSQVSHAMISELIEQEKVAIVRFIPKETSIVRFCALIPQEEKFDE